MCSHTRPCANSWQRPTSFSQPPADGDDSFSSLKSYLEFFGDASVNSMNPASLSHSLMGHDGQQQQQPLPADESASSRSASPQSNPGAQGNKDEQQQSHTKRKGAAEGDLDVEALKDRRSGHRDAAVHHTHGANAEPSDAAAAAASQSQSHLLIYGSTCLSLLTLLSHLAHRKRQQEASRRRKHF